MDVKSIHRRRLMTAKAINLVSRYGWLFYVIGLVWLCLFPLPQLQKKGYADDIDENALMPGQASRYFGPSDGELGNLEIGIIQGFLDRNANSSMKAHYLQQRLSSFGIDSGVQKFWITDLHGNVREYANAYAIVRAPRAAGTEANLVSAPWVTMTGEDNVRGASYLLALASFLTKYSHWSKDIIILITDGDILGMKAWIEAYHGRYGNIVLGMKTERLIYHGGVIEEGINIELPGNQDFSEIGIFPIGMNGQQPNADIVATVASSAVYSHIPVSLQNQTLGAWWPKGMPKHVDALFGILDYMKTQALGVPTSLHALFSRYKIEGVTVLGIRKEGEQAHIDVVYFGGFLESTLRTVSNLLERLHHSYWFYLMASPWHYIPIAFYIAPVILLSATLIFQSLALLWNSDQEESVEAPKASTPLTGTKYLSRPRGISSFSSTARDLITPILVVSLCSCFGIVTLLLPWQQLELPDLPVYQLLAIPGFVSVFLSTLVIPGVLGLFPKSKLTWMNLKCVCCCMMGITLLAVSTLNPSLSVFAALPAVPTFMLATPTKHSIWKGVKIGLLQLLSPAGLLILVSSVVSEATLVHSLQEIYKAYMFYDSWLLPYILCLYWPITVAVHTVVMF